MASSSQHPEDPAEQAPEAPASPVGATEPTETAEPAEAAQPTGLLPPTHWTQLAEQVGVPVENTGFSE